MIKNKRHLSNKTKWILGSSISILSTIPLISVSAVACSSPKESLVIPSVQIVNEPTNQVGYINETAVNPPVTNLAIFNINTQENAMFAFSCQWYSNSKNSTDGAKMISGATNSSYAVKSNEAKIGELKYYYAIVKGTYKNINLTPKVSQIASLTVKALPKFAVSWPTKQKDPELFGLLPASIAFEFSNQSSIKLYNILTNNGQNPIFPPGYQGDDPTKSNFVYIFFVDGNGSNSLDNGTGGILLEAWYSIDGKMITAAASTVVTLNNITGWNNALNSSATLKNWFAALVNGNKGAIPKNFNLNTSISNLSFHDVLNNAINDLFPIYKKFNIALPAITNPTNFSITNKTITGTITVGGWPIKLSINLS